jgi:hypothetical protein
MLYVRQSFDATFFSKICCVLSSAVKKYWTVPPFEWWTLSFPSLSLKWYPTPVPCCSHSPLKDIVVAQPKKKYLSSFIDTVYQNSGILATTTARGWKGDLKRLLALPLWR